MKEVTCDFVTAALRAVGVHEGDGLLVHSSIQYLGKPVGGVGMYLDALLGILGISEPSHRALSSMGTLAVPTFNFAFAHGEPYDPQRSPSIGMGSFSEFVRQHPSAKRTSHPMQSIAVIGRYASDLASRDTPSAFDPGSAYERMLELDFKILLLGASVQAISLLHYCEQRQKVPYRYWKDFQGEVCTPAGWETRSYRMFVRDLQIDPHIELHPVQALLETRRQWQSTDINYGRISLCRMLDFVAALDSFIVADPWSLVTNRPSLLSPV